MALKIIQESPVSSDSEIPSQAVNLLNESIDNAKLVIKEFPNSKYIDDSYFLIGKCSFLLSRYPAAERNLRRVIDNFHESSFYEESQVLLSYTLFRMGYEEDAFDMINKFSDKVLRKRSNMYLISNLKAENEISKNNFSEAYEFYLSAIDYSSNKSEKIAVLTKLISITKKQQDYDRLVEYLDLLSEISSGSNRVNAKLDWVEFQLERSEYKLLISELENMLNQSEFESEKLKLKIALAKAYMLYGELDKARNLLLDIVDEFQRKNETAEAYYYLAYIELDSGFDLDIAREYFDLSVKERSSSKYGRLSKEEKKKIDALLDMYEDLRLFEISSNPSENIDKTDDLENNKPISNGNSKVVDFGVDIELDFSNDSLGSPDSLLIAIAEALVFDFNKPNRSVDVYKQIIDNYQESKYVAQALYALSVYDQSADWELELNNSFPNSIFVNNTLKKDSVKNQYTYMDSMRDLSWNKMAQSYLDGYDSFINLYSVYKDTLSLYYAGYIADYLVNDFDRAITSYKEILDQYPSFRFVSDIDKRIIQIRDVLSEQISIIYHQQEFRKAINFLYDYNIDSAKVYLASSKSGESELISAVSRDKYNDILRLENINKEILENKNDSILYAKLFDKAEIFNSLLMKDSASVYYLKVIDHTESDFVNKSIVRIDRLFPSEKILKDVKFDPDSVMLDLKNLKLPSKIDIIMNESYKNEESKRLDKIEKYLSILPQEDSLETGENFPDVPIGPSMK